MKTTTLIKRTLVVGVAVSGLVFGGIKVADAVQPHKPVVEKWVHVYPQSGEGLYALIDRVNKHHNINTQEVAQMVLDKNHMENSNVYALKQLWIPVIK